MKRLSAISVAAVAAMAASLLAGCGSSGTRADLQETPSAAALTDVDAPLTNLSHLNFLLDSVPVTAVPGHTTYNIATEPTVQAPWTYADHNADGSFTPVGGGDYDAATNTYSQGAFNADDTSRTAVVYLRHWMASGDATSRQNAYETLRSLAFLQTDSGPDAGNVILWQQADGTLTPSATPIELPNPSDSEESFWVARTIWAFGTGYAAFKDSDPTFAAFLKERMHLSLAAVQRQSLNQYGKFDIATGVKVPAWLIIGESDASAEAVLGLVDYVRAAPTDKVAVKALKQLTAGIAAVNAGSMNKWPFGAIVPQNSTQGVWHAWAGLAPAALAEASAVVPSPKLVESAVKDTAQFTPQLLAAGGADNDWAPTPGGSQIAYGVDSRVQSLVSTAKAASAPGLNDLAAMFASWYFGANVSGQPAYNVATGACVDGIEPNGTVNLNSGAESTIMALMSMLTLDANPAVKAMALGLNKEVAYDGITTVTPANAPVTLAAGQTVTMPVAAADQDRNVYPVVNQVVAPSGSTAWTSGSTKLGSTANGGAGAQGVALQPGITFPFALKKVLPGAATALTGTANGPVTVQSALVQPLVSSAALSGPGGDVTMYVSATSAPATRTVSVPDGTKLVAQSYDSSGKPVLQAAGAADTVTVVPGGFTIAKVVKK